MIVPGSTFSVHGSSHGFQREPTRVLHQIIRNDVLPFARGFVFDVVSFHFRNQLPMSIDMVRANAARERAIEGEGMAHYLLAFQAQLPEALRAYKVPFLGTEWRDRHIVGRRSLPCISWTGASWVLGYILTTEKLGPDWRLLRVNRKL